MPHRSRQGYDGIPPDVFLKMARDPEAFERSLEEWDERKAAAVEAEAKLSAKLDDITFREKNVAEREEHAAKVTAEVNERREALEADETALAERTVEIEKREAAAKAMEASLAARETALQHKVDNALASVKALFVTDLRTFIDDAGEDSE